jgi:hypothetical protein
VLPHEHLRRREVARALGNLGQPLRRVGLQRVAQRADRAGQAGRVRAQRGARRLARRARDQGFARGVSDRTM